MQRKLGLERSLIFDSDEEAYTLVQHGQKYSKNEVDEDSGQKEPGIIKSEVSNAYGKKYEESDESAVR